MSDQGTLFLRVDGADVDPVAAVVMPSDRGFSYGDGVFRTVRVRGGRVAGWARHAQKLKDDHQLAVELGIEGTPAFLVGEILVPGADIEALKAAIQKARSKAA